ncbi:MAG: hypothetical protein P1R58_12470 [bacterium]|nr:hypothetical protein [bacterium]
MKRTINTLLFLLLLFPAVHSESLLDQLKIEGYLGGGSTDNLLLDSSATSETYSNAGAVLRLYPLSMTEVSLTAEYNKYSDLSSLDNFRYRTELKFIPTSDSARFSLYLYGAYDGRSYKAENIGVSTADFNNLTADAIVSAGYELNSLTHLRVGAAYKLSGYDNEFVEDKYAVDYFAGFNRTLFGSISFDLEGGLTSGNLEYTPRSVPEVGFPVRDWQTGEIDSSFTAYDSLEQGTLNSVYISPRISRSIGSKTGVSLTLFYRSFLDEVDSSVVFGYSTGILSPWVTDYEGEAVLLSIKSFLIPRLITTLSAGYWHKQHLPAAEQPWLIQQGADPIPKPGQEPINAKERTDYVRRTMVQLQMPFASRSGWFIEPYLTLEFSNNNSTISVYEYDNFSVSGGVSLRL